MINFSNSGKQIARWASHLESLPLLRRVSPSQQQQPERSTLEGFLKAQNLAKSAVLEVGNLVREGWTEKMAASLVDTYLQDHGVTAFFHAAYAWWGDRTRFKGVKSYSQYKPTDRQILPGEVFILDVAPIYDGFVADVGYTSSLGENPQLTKALNFLGNLKEELPSIFSEVGKGSEICRLVNTKFQNAGYDNIHEKYPFAILGHRVHERVPETSDVRWWHFGWQAYWALTSRGLFGQLLNENFEGSLEGLWAIEPHIGTQDFGAKFEEILVVGEKNAYWLEDLQ